MDKVLHLEYLRGKYIQLSRQFLEGLHSGKTPDDLKDMADIIRILIMEMETLERDIENSTG